MTVIRSWKFDYKFISFLRWEIFQNCYYVVRAALSFLSPAPFRYLDFTFSNLRVSFSSSCVNSWLFHGIAIDSILSAGVMQMLKHLLLSTGELQLSFIGVIKVPTHTIWTTHPFPSWTRELRDLHTPRTFRFGTEFNSTRISDKRMDNK